MSMLLSVCMIVKDEEKVLDRCLKSIHGIADELIVIDTGSIDKTKEIAKEYTDKVYDFEWVKDFSKARNYAASKASGKWILVIDADEYVDRNSFKEFKQNLKLNPPQNSINMVEIVSFVGETASSVAQSRHTRLYKNNKGIKFYRPIHEELRYKEGEADFGFVNLQLYHTGYMKGTAEEKNKTERNLSILLEKEDKKGIDYFYIGNEYRKLDQKNKAILYYQKSFSERESATVDYLTKLLVYLIITLYEEKRYSDALQVIDEAERAYPNNADYKYFRGLILYIQGNFNKAKLVFEYILSNKNNLVVDHSEEYMEYLPLIYLADIYEKDNDLHKAVEYYSRAASLKTFDDALWSKLLYLLGKHSNLEELTGFINRKIIPIHGMTEQRMIKVLTGTPLLNVQKLSRSLLDNEKLTDIENEALLLKNLLLDLNFEEISKLIKEKTLTELIVILQTNIFTIIDYIILVHEHKMFRDNLKKLSTLNDIENINLLLFEDRHKKMKLNNKERNLFVNVYRQVTVMNIDSIIMKLDSKLFLLNEELREKIKEIRNL